MKKVEQNTRVAKRGKVGNPNFTKHYNYGSIKRFLKHKSYKEEKKYVFQVKGLLLHFVQKFPVDAI